ncbi:hypothetical protein [Lacrimispora amygdalina]|uniref:hypothetical protein n=1 Tax=Lacrimispora amygdalina TaxID=253257 RepID=UPI000BE43E86|nr:hypothetical protein [Lacrimispora amygdalina]
MSEVKEVEVVMITDYWAIDDLGKFFIIPELEFEEGRYPGPEEMPSFPENKIEQYDKKEERAYKKLYKKKMKEAKKEIQIWYPEFEKRCRKEYEEWNEKLRTVMTKDELKKDNKRRFKRNPPFIISFLMFFLKLFGIIFLGILRFLAELLSAAAPIYSYLEGKYYEGAGDRESAYDCYERFYEASKLHDFRRRTAEFEYVDSEEIVILDKTGFEDVAYKLDFTMKNILDIKAWPISFESQYSFPLNLNGILNKDTKMINEKE